MHSADTVFDMVNHETDKLETKRKSKNKLLAAGENWELILNDFQ